MKILFVCTGNACRSPAAEALMKKLNADLVVDSAGTHPHYEIVELTRAYLRRHHADHYMKTRPESVDSKDLAAFDLIVAMEPQHRRYLLRRCPQCQDKIVVWNLSDPYFLPPDEAARVYDALRHKVLTLAEAVCE